jgi:predicted ribosome-associated RNA-binding protein Tma20
VDTGCAAAVGAVVSGAVAAVVDLGAAGAVESGADVAAASITGAAALVSGAGVVVVVVEGGSEAWASSAALRREHPELGSGSRSSGWLRCSARPPAPSSR